MRHSSVSFRINFNPTVAKTDRWDQFQLKGRNYTSIFSFLPFIIIKSIKKKDTKRLELLSSLVSYQSARNFDERKIEIIKFEKKKKKKKK